MINSARYCFRLIYIAFYTCCFTLILSGCSNKNQKQQTFSALPVSVIKISPRDTPISMEYIGQMAGFREVEVRPRVGGILLKRNYVEGRPVKEGELLFQIDPAPFKAALDQARANLALEQSNLTRAKQDYQRVMPLFLENAVSQKDRDDAVAAYQSAQASLEVARAKLKDAKINLSYTNVTSPISGITSKETHSEGSLVSSDGTALTTVSQLNPMYVNFSLSDNESLQMRKDIADHKLRLPDQNQFAVHLILSDNSTFAEIGKINFTDSIIESSTGTVRARAEVANPNNILMPGQFVRVRLDGGELLNAILIPEKAILTTQQGKQVWIVGKDNKAEPVMVDLGQNIGKQVVIKHGLKAGSQLVIDNLLKIRLGAPLKPQMVSVSSENPPAHKTQK